MSRGLMWLPLLAMFCWLAWAGWNEYQKLEAYRAWADQFERAKYDIFAVLGQQGEYLTWGKPTRKGPVNLQTFSLKTVRSLQLIANHQAIDPDQVPAKSRQVAIAFELPDSTINVPFTDLTLAVQWFKFLQQKQAELALF